MQDTSGHSNAAATLTGPTAAAEASRRDLRMPDGTEIDRQGARTAPSLHYGSDKREIMGYKWLLMCIYIYIHI